MNETPAHPIRPRSTRAQDPCPARHSGAGRPGGVVVPTTSAQAASANCDEAWRSRCTTGRATLPGTPASRSPSTTSATCSTTTSTARPPEHLIGSRQHLLPQVGAGIGVRRLLPTVTQSGTSQAPGGQVPSTAASRPRLPVYVTYVIPLLNFVGEAACGSRSGSPAPPCSRVLPILPTPRSNRTPPRRARNGPPLQRTSLSSGFSPLIARRRPVAAMPARAHGTRVRCPRHAAMRGQHPARARHFTHLSLHRAEVSVSPPAARDRQHRSRHAHGGVPFLRLEVG